MTEIQVHFLKPWGIENTFYLNVLLQKKKKSNKVKEGRLLLFRRLLLRVKQAQGQKEWWYALGQYFTQWCILGGTPLQGMCETMYVITALRGLLIFWQPLINLLLRCNIGYTATFKQETIVQCGRKGWCRYAAVFLFSLTQGSRKTQHHPASLRCCWINDTKIVPGKMLQSGNVR